ncbi:MAG: hypothetical protein L0229_13075 [Blastocatellia bacterium]|nr:hypothetical protein [Blastocatellia bacterium]
MKLIKRSRLSSRPRASARFLCVLCALLFMGLNSWLAQAPRSPFEDAPALPGTIDEGIEDVEGRDEWFRFQRAYPSDSIPPDARRRAWESSEKGGRARLSAATVAPRWHSIGPSPTSAFFGNWGPTSGRINAVALSQANSNLVLVGSSTGGIWRSTNGGGSFNPVSDDHVDLAVGSIAFSKSDPSIVYAGMGDKALGYLGSGVLKSTDSGATWRRVSDNSLPAPGTISKIEVDPTNPNQVYVAQNAQLSGERVISGGFYRSTNGGISWKMTLAGHMRDMAVSPSDSRTLYLGAIRGTGENDSSSGVYRSSNRGNSWEFILASPYGDSQTRDMKVAVTPARPQTVYAYTGGFDLNGFSVKVLVSEDGGATWTDRGGGGVDTGQFGYNTYIAADPADADKVYLGSRDLYRSTDGGLNWRNLTRNFTRFSSFYEYTPTFSSTHPDQHGLAFAPANSNEMYISNDGGISKTFDGGGSFQSLNATLSLTQFTSLALHPTDPQISYGGTQDNGTQRRLTGQDVWREFAGGDGGECVINPLDPGNVFVTYVRGNVFRFSNDGKNFERQIAWDSTFGEPSPGARIAFYPPFTGNGVDATLYFGTWRLFKSEDRGDRWFAPAGDTDLTKGINAKGRDVLSAIGVARSDTSVIYTGSAHGRAMASADGGASWADITAGLPDRFITSVTADPQNSDVAYLTVSGFETGHVFKTTDRGATWADISGNLPDVPANALLIDPIAPATIYVGTDIGVFRTSTGGAEWFEFNRGLPPVIVQAFAAQESGLIQIATYGRGVYELTGDVRLAISSVVFDGRKKLTIRGSGFGDNVRVIINGADRSSRVKNSSETEIKLKGKLSKLGLTPGENTLQLIDSEGGASNIATFVL